MSINDIDINKIVVSNNLPFDKQDIRNFAGYKDSEKLRPLCIFHLQMILYKINFDANRGIYFLIKNKKKLLLNIWKFEKKLGISSKTNLVANIYIGQKI